MIKIIYKNFPRISIENSKKYLMSIYPKFHTKLFPFSVLRTEKDFVQSDVTHENSIEKIYLANMKNLDILKTGDLILIYKTADFDKAAEYNSVATSICTIVEVKNINEFNSCDDFMDYIGKNTVFSIIELNTFWTSKKYPYIIKMLYNIQLPHKITRHDLCEICGLTREEYFGFLTLTDDQFNKILVEGKVNPNYIVRTLI